MPRSIYSACPGTLLGSVSFVMTDWLIAILQGAGGWAWSWRTYAALEIGTLNPTSKRGAQKQGLAMTSELVYHEDGEEAP